MTRLVDSLRQVCKLLPVTYLVYKTFLLCFSSVTNTSTAKLLPFCSEAEVGASHHHLAEIIVVFSRIAAEFVTSITLRGRGVAVQPVK
jgi:hypothetical protein